MRSKIMVPAEAKKSPIKDLLTILNDIQVDSIRIFTSMIGFVTWPPI